ncbi:FIG00949458: hypothetical protein [Pseudoalteromonas luteoviolacea B = ATCC 29581]|nr:FIG00949458: hypothetical protein [Pseudoalteromonas luteoviolacea B = ATCC 29581]
MNFAKKSLALLSVLTALNITPVAAHADNAIVNAVNDTARSEKNRARDEHRHPAETLEFFGLKPDMTVVEIAPGGGWYSEILAPVLKGKGVFYAAHFPADSEIGYYKRSLTAFKDTMAADERYAETKLTEFAPPTHLNIAPEGSADLVLTFRNVHNWYMNKGDETVLAAFQSFNKALKPGGILGVVEHRLPEDRDDNDQKRSGYMKQSYVVNIAKQAGFELVASSDINANSLDTADHPKGVWTLPPTLALGDEDANKYRKIGESDRMTLKFKKR